MVVAIGGISKAAGGHIQHLSACSMRTVWCQPSTLPRVRALGMNKMGMGQSEVVRECLTCSLIHLALGKQGSHQGLGAAGTWSSAGGLSESCSSWDARMLPVQIVSSLHAARKPYIMKCCVSLCHQPSCPCSRGTGRGQSRRKRRSPWRGS